MVDIFNEVSEDVRRDQMQALWRRFGPVLIGGAVAVVAGTAGYVGWQRWQETRLAAASERLAGLGAQATAQANLQTAEALEGFAREQGGGLAVLARLHEADVRARSGDAAGALAIYDALSREAEGGPAFRDLAAVLWGLHALATVEPAQIEARLQPLTGADQPYRFSAKEILALAAQKRGDAARADQLFQELADDAAAPSALRRRAAEMAAAIQP
ncbi:MAG TPA: tetratricopeptide repeat protein [Alphaproteobacteria bacterium]|nr:tetratricopeptide repeat protein [Alphaproteobacteria bacterium]